MFGANVLVPFSMAMSITTRQSMLHRSHTLQWLPRVTHDRVECRKLLSLSDCLFVANFGMPFTRAKV